ncbi:epsin [Microdochium nivale]|nr:epsin [Microdochium nivale]
MDFNSLKDQVSSLTLYDLKAGVRKVQNAVMNFTEMESKVREATNNEPWGASSTTMQEIANGTFNYQTLNEIMPMIYRRFTEKSAEEWRQIYKALQLLEFLIKHGSERVIDDARGHITLLKMLRQFHFIDANGKDQGINVRNRAKELSELLGDVEKIRTERKKARSNKAKYTGVEGGGGGFSSSSGGRYGGFGSESGGYGAGGSGSGGPNGGYGGYSGGVYGDGGGFGGQTDDWRDNGASSGGGGRDRFEEYDEGDDTPSSSTAKSKRPERTERAGTKKTVGATEPSKKKEPEVDLFSFDDPAPTTTSIPAAVPQASNGSSALGALSETADDDDFDDFQSAAPATSTNTNFGGSIPAPMVTSSAQSTLFQPKPVSAPQQASISDLMSSISPPPPSSGGTPGANYSAFSAPQGNPMASSVAQKPAMGYQAAQPNYFQSASAQSQQASKPSSTSAVSTPSGMSALNRPAAPAAKPAASGGADPFANLWGASGSAKKTPVPGAGPKMGDLAKEKTSASLWGAPANPSNQASGSNNNNSGGFSDLL